MTRTIAPCGSDLLIRWAGCDATEAFTSVAHSPSALNLLHSFCVGTLEQDVEQEEVKEKDGYTTISLSSAAAIER